jgi:hypothetical protein
MTPRRLPFLFLALILSFAAPVPSARAEDEPAKDEAPKPEPKPSKKKAAAKKKTFDYERSKYKSREISQTSHYKFNENAEPIGADAKKPSAKKKKRSEPPEMKEGAQACGSEENCAEKKSEADAL